MKVSEFRGACFFSFSFLVTLNFDLHEQARLSAVIVVPAPT